MQAIAPARETRSATQNILRNVDQFTSLGIAANMALDEINRLPERYGNKRLRVVDDRVQDTNAPDGSTGDLFFASRTPKDSLGGAENYILDKWGLRSKASVYGEGTSFHIVDKGTEESAARG